MYSHSPAHDNHITTAEQAKLAHITITNAANLSTMETATTTNATNITGNTSSITGILNNGIASTLKTAVDTNTSGRLANTSSITGNTSSITGILNNGIASTLKTAVDTNTSGRIANAAAIVNKLDNNADDSMAGDLTIYKASDDNHLNIFCDNNQRARVNICGVGSSSQGSGILYIGQGNSSSSTGTYGGYFAYLGDGTPSADIGTFAASTNYGLADYFTFGSVNNGLNRAIWYANNANSGTNYADMNYLGNQFVYNSKSYYVNGGAYILRNSSIVERGSVHTGNTVRGTYSGATGWTPTGTGSYSKVMLENTLGEGAGIALSADAVCIWHADAGVYFVDEDAITGSSYAGYYALLTTGGTLTTSDERLKTDIKDLSFNRNILEIVNDIPVKTYYDKCMYDLSGNEERYEKNKHKYTTLRLGTLAQSMPQEVKDLLVKDDEGEFPDKHYSVNYGRLVMFCIEAIKELKREIDILKEKN